MERLFLFSFDFKNFQRNLLWFSFFLMFNNIVLGQVRTTVLNGAKLEDYVPRHDPRRIINNKILPSVDIKAAQKKDTLEGKADIRFGVKSTTFITKNDGDILIEKDTIIWLICLQSRDASSINFNLKDLTLPDGSSMYIYSKDETMVCGPITNKHIYKGLYATDIIKGEEVVIKVIVAEKDFEKFNITISDFVHGYKKKLKTRAFGDSQSCQVDVNCSVGIDIQRDAVARIFSNNSELCSGALINNACQDFRAFFLTAAHCQDGNETNWVFRFNYDSPNPTSPNCNGSEPTSWIQMCGATIRATGSPDFMLLELNQSINGLSTISLAGWDRDVIVPVNVFGIHHPQGDVKKIARSSSGVLAGQGTNNGTNYLKYVWNSGLSENSSSGSPLFNPDGRIVGQLWGGLFSCNNDREAYYGRLAISWNGNVNSSSQSNITRLRDFLSNGITNPPMTIDAIRPILPTISGSSTLCNTSPSNTTIFVGNLIQGSTVTWNVTPTYLFATGSGASTSGTGTSAVIRPAANSSTGTGGLATITFSFNSGSGCNPVSVSKDIWIGKPLPTPVLNQTVYCKAKYGNATVVNANTAGISTIQWSYTGPLNSFNGQYSYASFITGPGTGSGIITATATNSCGTNSGQAPFYVNNCSFMRNPISSSDGITVSPNPVKNQLQIEIADFSEINTEIVESKNIFTLIDIHGRIILETKSYENRIFMNISDVSAGIYCIRVEHGKEQYRKSISIIK
jgi:lysyl endopeptidase